MTSDVDAPWNPYVLLYFSYNNNDENLTWEWRDILVEEVNLIITIYGF